jgi:integrase
VLIQAGVSPKYVQLEMGHESINVTMDVYGHLIPGDNANWINDAGQDGHGGN